MTGEALPEAMEPIRGEHEAAPVPRKRADRRSRERRHSAAMGEPEKRLQRHVDVDGGGAFDAAELVGVALEEAEHGLVLGRDLGVE